MAVFLIHVLLLEFVFFFFGSCCLFFFLSVNFHFFFKLEDNCFTMLCWFLLYNNVNQLYVYICPLPLNPPSLQPPNPSKSSQSTAELPVTRQLPTSFSFTHGSVRVSASLLIRPILCFPLCVDKSIFYIYISIPDLQIGSSVPFSRFYMC